MKFNFSTIGVETFKTGVQILKIEMFKKTYFLFKFRSSTVAKMTMINFLLENSGKDSFWILEIQKFEGILGFSKGALETMIVR